VRVTLPLELVGRFEQHLAEAVESLLTHSLRVPGNPEGYALFREGSILATLSTNPRAGWATQTYGIGGQPADAVRRVVEFFNLRGVPARMRIVPGAFTSELADTLSGLGLRHVGFHTILWTPLPRAVEPPPPIDIREVSTQEEMDSPIDIQLGSYGIPPEVIDRLRPLRRTWLGSPGRRLYLAYVNGHPAAQAILHWREEIAYLESAGTLTAYRRRGLQRALIRRRIADATKLGCRVMIGGADFENESRTNQMACGLTVAYLAAVWTQRADAMLGLTRAG
jgi:GNAT superfamily N-acetyltransferase